MNHEHGRLWKTLKNPQLCMCLGVLCFCSMKILLGAIIQVSNREVSARRQKTVNVFLWKWIGGKAGLGTPACLIGKKQPLIIGQKFGVSLHWHSLVSLQWRCVKGQKGKNRGLLVWTRVSEQGLGRERERGSSYSLHQILSPFVGLSISLLSLDLFQYTQHRSEETIVDQVAYIG